MSEALQREELLRESARLMHAGMSQNAAAEFLGVSAANLTRWRRAYAAEGLQGLEDKREGRCGRKPLVVLTETEELAVKRLYVQTESKTTALRMFAGSKDCREEVADAITKKRTSKHTITSALRNQITLPQQVINYHKSPKQVRVNAFVNPRTMTYIDALGMEQRLTPGDLFERDDMSNNFLGWVSWPWGGDPCSDKFGVRVARGQNLLMIDAASLFFTSFNFLVRLRDSYRADDIWQWVGQTYRDIGMPRIGERWERGTWASRRLRGDEEVAITAGHTDEMLRLGGMQALGLRVIESQSPTTKIIEGRFNFFQTACQTIRGNIGRRRGEMERENKIWTACRLGHRDPRDYFLSFDQVSDAIEEKLHWVNSEPVEGLSYRGIPAQMWAEGIAANPLKTLSPERGFLFSRDKREITSRKGHVMVRYTAPEGGRAGWWFYHPELFRYDGLKIAVYMDGYTPGDGATLVVAEGKDSGKVIGHAELIQGCPQFALGFQTGEQDASASQAMLGALERKKEFTNAVRAEYRALGVDGRRIARTARVDDGAGRAASISSSATAPRVEPVAVATSPRAVRPAAFDEDAELAAIERLEADARQRGDLLTV